MNGVGESQEEYVRRPDWGPALDYWFPDGEVEPDIPWPDNFEVCGVPAYDPSPLARDPKRHGTHVMVWPMFDVDDPVRSIEVICGVLESMDHDALERWYALPDRYLHISGGDVDMNASNLDSAGLVLPGEMIQRIRKLRLRVQITLHPASSVKVSGGF